jgi:Sulfatase
MVVDAATTPAAGAPPPHGQHARLHLLPRRYVFACVALCVVALAPQLRLGRYSASSSSSSRSMLAMTTTMKTTIAQAIGSGTYSNAAEYETIPSDPAADFQWDLMAATGLEEETEEKKERQEAAGKAQEKANNGRPNLLFILVDQMRWDTMGFLQRQLPDYAGKLTINTPNLDRLAEGGINFDAYCVTTPCVPSRGSLKTGCTVRRTGISGNSMDSARYYRKMKVFQDRVERLRTFEQILVEELGYKAEFYGKHHIPETMLFGFNNKSAPLYANTFYDFAKDEFTFRLEQNSMKQYITYAIEPSVCE